MHISVFSCLDDLVYKNRYIRSDVSRYSFPSIRDTYMMHFEPEHIFENGEMVHKYELPEKDCSQWWQFGWRTVAIQKISKKKYKKNSKKKFQIFFFKFVHASFELTRLEWKLDIGKFDLEMKNLIIYIFIFVL